MSELNSLQFVQKLQESFKQYKKQLGDTNDDADAAHFFPQELKNFLIKHKKEIDILSNMNYERYFVVWIRKYIYNETKK